MLNSARWIGATVGTVAFGALLGAVRESKLDDSLAGESLSAEQMRQVDHLVLADEDAQAVAVNHLGQGVVDAVSDAFASGYGAGLWLCAGALAVAVLVAAPTLRRSA